jgi:hypothetical protein
MKPDRTVTTASNMGLIVYMAANFRNLQAPAKEYSLHLLIRLLLVVP